MDLILYTEINGNLCSSDNLDPEAEESGLILNDDVLNKLTLKCFVFM